MHAIRESYPAIRSGALAVLLLGAASSARAQGPEAPHWMRRAPAAAAQAAADEKPTMEITTASARPRSRSWTSSRTTRTGYDAQPSIAAAQCRESSSGNDGRFYLERVRQSRLGVKGTLPTASGDVKGQFEFDMFGVGGDAPAPDDDSPAARVGPVEAGRRGPDQQPVHGWRRVPEHHRCTGGPNGMLFFRNVQGVLGTVQRRQPQMRESPSRRRSASGDSCGVLSDRVGNCRTSSRAFRRRISPVTIDWRESGATSRSAARCATSPTTTCSPPNDKFDPERARRGAGASASVPD